LQLIEEYLNAASDFIWGPRFLIPLLLFTGLFLTVRLRGLQFRRLAGALYTALIVRREPGSTGDISHYQALMTALAATVGTGNIVGVATAIALGGPGALFWMWVTGLLGMATKYSEALLSVKYRTTDSRGEQAGGPMYYLAFGLRRSWLGKPLGALFALFTALAAFGIGNMVQSNAVADAMNGAFGIDPGLTGMVVAGVVALVIIGGIRSIGRVTGVFVPTMIVVYVATCTVVWVVHIDAVPMAFARVFNDAFTGSSAAGGFLGAGIAQAIRYGVARGIFSNESGLGSAGIAAAAAQTREPVRQALVSMTQTFIDTLVVCTFTGIALIASGAWLSDANGAGLTQFAFESSVPFGIGPALVAISLAMFAFSTMLGWSYYGERSIEYLLGEWAIVPYRLLFVGAAYFGAVRTLDFVWVFSDVMNGLMALPNLIGLLLLSGVVVKETRAYFERDRDSASLNPTDPPRGR